MEACHLSPLATSMEAEYVMLIMSDPTSSSSLLQAPPGIGEGRRGQERRGAWVRVWSWFSAKVPPGSLPALPSAPSADKTEQPPASRPEYIPGGRSASEGMQKCSLWQQKAPHVPAQSVGQEGTKRAD